MKKLIKRIIERLYYKCYPDRVNDHEIATRPIIPVIHEERRDIVKLKAQVILPIAMEAKDEISGELIRQELAVRLARAIEHEIEIQSDCNYYTKR